MYPLYREPDWFGRGAQLPSGTGSTTIRPAGERPEPTSRRVPISTDADRPEQERIAAREKQASKDVPRERVRGSGPDRE